MSRTFKGSKGTGSEYWGKRAMSICKPGRISKKLTSGIERMRERNEINSKLCEIYQDSFEFNLQIEVLKKI